MRMTCLSKFASPCLTLALLCASAAQTTPTNPNANTPPSAVQSRSTSSASAQSLSDAEMADRVRQEFRHAWEGYKKYAWGHDALKPLSKSSHDWYGVPLLMSPVDALDTMMLMGMKDEANQTREYIAKNLSFDRDIYVKNFEITIRLLGGLLSSYQLTGDKRLLALADDLGTRLLPAFNSPTGMPYVYVNLKTGAVRGEETILPRSARCSLNSAPSASSRESLSITTRRSAHWSKSTTGARPLAWSDRDQYKDR